MKLIETLKKYPWTLVYSFLLAFFTSYHTTYTLNVTQQHILVVAGLAFPFFAGLMYRYELVKTDWKEKTAGLLLWLLCFVLYYYTLPEGVFEERRYFFEFFAVVLVAAGFVLTYPLGHKREQLTWSYTASVYMQALKTILFTGITFACVMVFFWSLHTLFQMEIHYTWYPNAWFFCAMFLSQLFFFTFLPSTFATIQQEEKGTEIFLLESLAKFVLFPVVCVYAVTLYIYDVMIIIQHSLPSGLLGYSVAFFGVSIISTFFFLHHLRKEMWWVQRGASVAYLLLLPQVGILFYALWLRVEQYGMTEPRYLLGALGVFFFITLIRELLLKEKKISLIPMGVMVIMLPTTFGPWSMFRVSEDSQIARLQVLLEKTQLIKDGHMVKVNQPITTEDKQQINEIVQYLRVTHGEQKIRDRIKDGGILLDDKNVQGVLGVYYDDPHIAMECYGDRKDATHASTTEVQGFDAVLTDISLSSFDGERRYTLTDQNQHEYTLTMQGNNGVKMMLKDGDTILMTLFLDELTKQVNLTSCEENKHMFTLDHPVRISTKNDTFEMVYEARQMTVKKEKENWKVSTTSGILLLKGLK